MLARTFVLPFAKVGSSFRETMQGPKRLTEYLRRTRMSKTRLAALLGLKSPSPVSEWTKGTRRPDADLRRLLERLTQGSVEGKHWVTAQESAAYVQAVRRIDGYLQTQKAA